MADDSFCFLPAMDVARRVRRGDISPVTVVDAFLDRIERRNDDLTAYVTVLEEEALAAARDAERAIDDGEIVGPLHGVPIALKDLFAFKAGVRNTFGSKAFAEFVPEENAVLVERLEAAGAIVLGKTNTPEFGRKATTDNPLFGATGNPYDSSRTAGGSSGGSAAAVADGLAALAQGSDRAGSVRIPASACGVYGLKPTAGRIPTVSRPNGFAHGTPFIDAGPLTRTVEDAALMMAVMAGPHPGDPLCLPDDGTDYLGAVERPVDDLRIAFTPGLGITTLDEAVRDAIEDVADALSMAGATVEPVETVFDYSWDELYEPFSHHLQHLFAGRAAEFLDSYEVDLLGEHRELVTDEVVNRVTLGRELSNGELNRATAMRTAAFDSVRERFEEYDLMLSATLAVLPFDKDLDGPPGPGDGTDAYREWLLTWPFNWTGHPAASVPAGLTGEGLPVGAQLVGPRFGDDRVLAASAAVERVRSWADAYPPERTVA